jgi:transcriptional regulator with XRE-family HTH domain
MEENITKKLGLRIAKLRKERGWSQIEYASRCGVSANYIGNIERGEYNPTIVVIEKLALGFNITISELFKF